MGPIENMTGGTTAGSRLLRSVGAWSNFTEGLVYKAAGNELLKMMETKPDEITAKDVMGLAQKYKLNDESMQKLMQKLDQSGAMAAAMATRKNMIAQQEAQRAHTQKTGLPYETAGKIMEIGAAAEAKPEKDPRNPYDDFARGYEAKLLKENPNLSSEELQLASSQEWQRLQAEAAKNKSQFNFSLRGGGNEPMMSTDAIDLAAAQYLSTGQMPSLGMRNSANRTAIIDRAAQKAKEMGVSPSDVPALRAEFGALKGSLNNQQKTANMMGSFVRNMDKQLDRLDKIKADLVSRVGVRAMDVPIRAWKTKFAGSGNEAILSAYTIEISNEIGKLSTGSSASIRELSVEAQRRWEKIHDPNLSMGELQKVLNETRHMGKMRMDSANEEMGKTKEIMKRIFSDDESGKTSKTAGKVDKKALKSKYGLED